jgi:Lar family restriction alleviation protein
MDNLIQRLEITAEELEDKNLKPMAATVREAIKALSDNSSKRQVDAGVMEGDSRNSGEQLKPCPFCGEKPKIQSYSPLNGYYLYSIECINSNCPTNPGTVDFSKRKNAIKRWNERA